MSTMAQFSTCCRQVSATFAANKSGTPSWVMCVLSDSDVLTSWPPKLSHCTFATCVWRSFWFSWLRGNSLALRYGESWPGVFLSYTGPAWSKKCRQSGCTRCEFAMSLTPPIVDVQFLFVSSFMHISVQAIIWTLTLFKSDVRKVPVVSLVIRDGSFIFGAMLGMSQLLKVDKICANLFSTVLYVSIVFWNIKFDKVMFFRILTPYAFQHR